MIKIFKQFLLGATSLFESVTLLFHDSKLRRLLLIPVLLNIIVILLISVLGIPLLVQFLNENMLGLMPLKNSFSSKILYTAAILFIGLGIFFFIIFLGYIFYSLLALPFNSLIAETLLKRAGLLENQPFTLLNWLKKSYHLLLISLKKMFVFLVLGIAFAILNFFPILNLVSSLGLMLLIVFDSADYYFEILGYNFNQRITFFKKYIFIFLGIAVALGLVILIPFLNLFFVPATIVACGKVVCEILSSGLKNDS